MGALVRKVLVALRRVREEVVWREGKADRHLKKRIRKGHLPKGSTRADYESIIVEVVSDPSSDVYVYVYGDGSYPTAVAVRSGEPRLVMVGPEGVMETAFVVDRPGYLLEEGYIHLGKLEELEDPGEWS